MRRLGESGGVDSAKPAIPEGSEEGFLAALEMTGAAGEASGLKAAEGKEHSLKGCTTGILAGAGGFQEAFHEPDED